MSNIYGDHQNKRVFTEAGFQHTRSEDTPANTLIGVGGLVGVTTDFTPSGQMFWVAEQGTFELTNNAYTTLTYAKGDTVKATVTNGVGVLATTGTVIVGHCTEVKAAGSDTVKVRLATGRNG